MSARRAGPSAVARRVGLLALLCGALLSGGDFAGAALPRESGAATLLRLAAAEACHQRPERSLRLAGRPLASCARCTGLHLGGVVGGLLLLLLPLSGGASPRALVALGLAPLALDVAASLILSSWDHPWLRLATGLGASAFVLLSAGSKGA